MGALNMGAYHILLVHFPLSLWTTAVLVIAIRAFSNGAFAQACDRVLAPLLLWGTIMGALAYIVGFFVWPLPAISATPLGRNHLLAGSWTLAYWALLWITRARLGETVWEGGNRWIMLGLGALGGILLTVTGALGGHLLGAPSAVSKLFGLLGWEVYTTFYVPNFMLVLLVLATIALIGLGVAGRARRGVRR